MDTIIAIAMKIVVLRSKRVIFAKFQNFSMDLKKTWTVFNLILITWKNIMHGFHRFQSKFLKLINQLVNVFEQWVYLLGRRLERWDKMGI